MQPEVMRSQPTRKNLNLFCTKHVIVYFNVFPDIGTENKIITLLALAFHYHFFLVTVKLKQIYYFRI